MNDTNLKSLLSIELIEELEARFPEQSADLKWTDREVWYKSGQRSVVRFLREQFRRQNENILNSRTVEF